ncbi:MAG: tannase/feruloyl esterase family alpha/beta hydrolase [Pseudorhodoferax sp.]
MQIRSGRGRTGVAFIPMAAIGLAVLGGCGDSDDSSAAAPLLTCDDSLKTAFNGGAETTVVAVKAFGKGAALSLSAAPGASTPVAANDMCMVKLMVGPGNAGPAGAPSTSAGIGIEVWLPSKQSWNQRFHALGGGGWQGGGAGLATEIASLVAAAVAGTEAAVSSFTDTGHTGLDGSFAMQPDGSINETLWTDFSSRAIHEQAVKTKALATAYYGTAPKYSYWDGGSTGGRQGLNLAQNHPEDFDGIVALFPAINWSRFITAELYPQIVFQRDLGGTPLTTAQQDLMSNAAIASCDLVGGQHLGYIQDPEACAYDPATDPGVLCVSDGGTNTSAACVSVVQATAMNKIWYGMTADGSVPSPASDNGWPAANAPALPSGSLRWWGLARGTSTYAMAYAPFGLNGLASPNGPFPIASDQVALELQNPSIADPGFVNATGNGQSLWKGLGYAQLSDAYDQGVALQARFGNINTDSPDLSAFKARGGKLLTYHGLADELIMPQGTVNYYNRVVAQMGGLADVQSFYRLYLVPGVGHGTPNGTSNASADVPNFGPTQVYEMMTKWVEQGTAPGAATLQSQGGHSGLVCVHPQKARYAGSGDPRAATSYGCD